MLITQRDGYVHPALFFQIARQPVNLVRVTEFFLESTDSEAIRIRLKVTLAQLQTTAYGLITEAWLVSLQEKSRPSIFRDEAYKQAGLKSHKNLSDHPGRQSIIVIGYQEKVMRISRCWQVLKIGIYTIGEIIEVKGATGFLARLFGGSENLVVQKPFRKRGGYV